MGKSRAANVRCVVVTPEATVFDQEADFIAFTAEDGEVGILPNRAPLVARLGSGELRLQAAGKTVRFFVDGGFAQVKQDMVTILTSQATPAELLKRGVIDEQFKALAAEVPTSNEAIERRLAKLARARAQRRLAQS